MLITENVLITSNLKNETITKLAIIDALYGLGAILTLITGLLLWFSVGKSQVFYTSNIIFHGKLGIFLLSFFISLMPTVFFLKNRDNTVVEVNVPAYIVTIKRLELLLLVVLPLLAVLMARGIGIA